MTDEELQAEVDRVLTERGFKIVDGLQGHLAQTGQQYKQKVIEAHPRDMVARIVAYIVTSARRARTIYWRIRPERDGTRVYFRFLVSDRPVIGATGSTESFQTPRGLNGPAGPL